MHFLDLLIVACAAALAGILVGRRYSRDRLRCQELESQLEGAKADAARYRENVAAHFTQTSELVHRLTLQYRAVYDHLAEGARTLCPDRMLELSHGDSAEALLSAGTDRAAAGEAPATAAAGASDVPSDVPSDDAADPQRGDEASAVAH